MVQFERTVNASEVRYVYLNLTDDLGRTYGSLFPPHRTKMVVVDGQARRTAAAKHHGNQLWNGLSPWFSDNAVTAGMRIRVRFDINERTTDGLPVLHLELANAPPQQVLPAAPGALATASPADTMMEAPELPLSLEKQLEDFLSGNLQLLEQGLQLYKDEDGREGRQYPTDVGVIDLLCSRPNGEILVVELKRGRSSDTVVGQVSRYMGWVSRHLANGRPVKGLILTYDRDDALRYAVYAHPSLELRRFKLRLEIIPDDEPEPRRPC